MKESKKSMFKFGRRSSKKDKKKRLDKRDIGTPANFTHVSHAGFDPQHGLGGLGAQAGENNSTSSFVAQRSAECVVVWHVV